MHCPTGASRGGVRRSSDARSTRVNQGRPLRRPRLVRDPRIQADPCTSHVALLPQVPVNGPGHPIFERRRRPPPELSGPRHVHQLPRRPIRLARVEHDLALVFDEATSSLDVHTEAAVLRALQGFARERTPVTIAHRLDTVRRGNHMVVLKRGWVVGEGPPGQALVPPAPLRPRRSPRLAARTRPFR